MDKRKFEIDGVPGEFYCDVDELKSYSTVKHLALGEADPAGMFEAIERVYMGNDEEYVDRIVEAGAVGDAMKALGVLGSAASEAANVKN